MARCSRHSYSYDTGRDTQRGRPVKWCDDCERLTNENKEKRAAKSIQKLEGGQPLTRAAGRMYVERVANARRAKVNEAEQLANQEAQADYARAAAAPEIIGIQLQIETLQKRLRALLAPHDTTRLEAIKLASLEAQRKRHEIYTWQAQALQNLQMRCHIISGSKECGKFLDYNGHCPVHGEIMEPGA